jgi:heterotetrameric sarcosine oxidase delta subunit
MLVIECPWCGARDEAEFRYGGQAHIAYPAEPMSTDDQEWAEYLFLRNNPRGRFPERWVHTSGCRRWFNAVRDTATNDFLGTYPMSASDIPAARSTPEGRSR